MAEPGAPTCYGLDVGGTKIELVACDAALQVLWRRRVATPQGDYAAFLQAVVALVAAADAALGR
ncbi:ROK family protein, partial [Xanthomonas sp. SHU 199]|uniref:ROK family protein n=1 Tax=Xanthomonas sp. SHU 199 TaxID=1591174 RepID=UPI000585AE00